MAVYCLGMRATVLGHCGSTCRVGLLPSADGASLPHSSSSTEDSAVPELGHRGGGGESAQVVCLPPAPVTPGGSLSGLGTGCEAASAGERCDGGCPRAEEGRVGEICLRFVPRRADVRYLPGITFPCCPARLQLAISGPNLPPRPPEGPCLSLHHHDSSSARLVPSTACLLPLHDREITWGY